MNKPGDQSVAAQKKAAIFVDVMVVDDQATARELHEALVKAADPLARTHKFSDASAALEWAKNNKPDLVLTDLQMPGTNGVDFIKLFRTIEHGKGVPIIVITTFGEKKVRDTTYAAGAIDFLPKPVVHSDCIVRVRNHLAMVRDRKCNEQGSGLGCEAEIRALMLFAKTAERGREDRSGHITRVSRLAGLVARAMGLSDAEEIEIVAMLHDVGNISVPEGVLTKPGKLTPAETKQMRCHVNEGKQILEDGGSERMRLAAMIAESHHERFDGSGYPKGLAGEDIPIAARVVGLVDTLEAMVSDRPYRSAISIDAALDFIEAESGKLFCPKCVGALLRTRDEARQILGGV